ncbi:hypothetical protein SKAU_G00049150, partial [Synaphobranchus kaupii]
LGLHFPKSHSLCALLVQSFPLVLWKYNFLCKMRCKMSYRLPCSPGSSPTYSGNLVSYRGRCSASGASVVAIDNKIEQAMDLVKSHLMYAVREEVEVLKEQIKELYERNSVLERENAVLKSLANNEQLSQLSSQLTNPGSTSPQQPPTGSAPAPAPTPRPPGGQPAPPPAPPPPAQRLLSTIIRELFLLAWYLMGGAELGCVDGRGQSPQGAGPASQVVSADWRSLS